jgi:hypothetical protein
MHTNKSFIARVRRQQFPLNPREVCFRINARREDLRRHGDLDGIPMFERAQLFQRLGDFQGRAWQRRQIGRGIPHDRRRCRCGADRERFEGSASRFAGHRIARPRNRCAAEVQRVVVAAAHQLHAVRVKQFINRLDRRCQGRHRRGTGRQRLRHRLDAAHRRLRFIALQVDDHQVFPPRPQARHLGKTIGAGGMFDPRHHHIDPAAIQRIRDACIVGGNHHLARAGSKRSLAYAHDHGNAGDLAQRLAGQALGCIARGDGNHEIREVRHGHNSPEHSTKEYSTVIGENSGGLYNARSPSSSNW